jgi:hypothetical protein
LVGAFPQLVIPLAPLDALDLALQSVVSVLFGADVLGDFVAVGGIQLGDELGDEVLVLQRFLDRGQAGGRQLPLAGEGAMWAVAVGVGALLMLDLPPQAVEIEGAQGIRAQTRLVEEWVGGHVGVPLQHIRDGAKDGGPDAVGMQALEEQERFEVRVGGEAVIHSPSVRTTTRVQRDGSQGDGGGGQDGQTRIAWENRDGGRGRVVVGRWARRLWMKNGLALHVPWCSAARRGFHRCCGAAGQWDASGARPRSWRVARISDALHHHG